MSRHRASYESSHMRGTPADDAWEGTLAAGDWVIAEGAMGYAYGYGRLAIVRPANLEMATDTNVGVMQRLRRDQVRDVVTTEAAARAIFERLERLRMTQPYQVFNQRHYRGRYQDLLTAAK